MIIQPCFHYVKNGKKIFHYRLALMKMWLDSEGKGPQETEGQVTTQKGRGELNGVTNFLRRSGVGGWDVDVRGLRGTPSRTTTRHHKRGRCGVLGLRTG